MRRNAAKEAGIEFDDDNRPIGFSVGRAAAKLDWLFRKEQAGDKLLFRRLSIRKYAAKYRASEKGRAALAAWRARNREKVRAQWREYAKTETAKASRARWKKKTKYWRKYYAENREKCLTYLRAWKAANRDRVKEYERRNNAKRRLEEHRREEAKRLKLQRRRARYAAANEKRRATRQAAAAANGTTRKARMAPEEFRAKEKARKARYKADLGRARAEKVAKIGEKYCAPISTELSKKGERES